MLRLCTDKCIKQDQDCLTPFESNEQVTVQSLAIYSYLIMCKVYLQNMCLKEVTWILKFLTEIVISMCLITPTDDYKCSCSCHKSVRRLSFHQEWTQKTGKGQTSQHLPTHFFFLQLYSPTEISSWEIWVALPWEKPAATESRYPTYGACQVFQCFHNPPNSDMDYRIFNVRIIKVFVHVYTNCLLYTSDAADDC